jgi:hypothetical protein
MEPIHLAAVGPTPLDIPNEPSVWRKRLFARPEPGNDRKQDLEVHVVKDDWHEGIVVRSVVGAVGTGVALSVLSRFRDMYGSLEFQPIDRDNGYLSLVTHIPLAPFTMSDPTAMVNFISEFIGRADKLEEALLGGADVF